MSGVVIIDGHVQGLALTRSYGEKNIPVIIIDRNKYPIARYSKYCTGFYKCPDYLSDEFIDFLLNLGQIESLKDWLLIPCDDHIVYTISKRKNELKRIFKVITVDFNILQNIINKRNLYNIAKNVGLPVIKTFYPQTHIIQTSTIVGFRFPILIKGIEGQNFYKNTKSKAFRVNNLEELNKILDKVSQKLALLEVMAQEMIPLGESNKVVSVTVFCVKGEIMTNWIGKKIREHPIWFGTATYSQSISDLKLLEQVKPLLKALNYEGVCEIEFLQDPRDGIYYLIEINPRTWLWVGLAKACGVDYALLMYNYINNIPLNFPQSYKIGIYWKNELTDFIFTYIGLMKGVIKFKTFLQHLFKSKLKALYLKGDIKPFWMYMLLIPYIKFKR